MRVLSTGWNTFLETGKYTCVTVEYAGLFSYSVVKRGGLLVTDGVLTVTRPVAKAVSRPFGYAWDKTTGIFTGRKQKEKIRGLEEKVTSLEERLANIEKYGLVPASPGNDPRAEKALSNGKRFVLQQILQDTKSLRDED